MLFLCFPLNNKQITVLLHKSAGNGRHIGSSECFNKDETFTQQYG